MFPLSFAVAELPTSYRLLPILRAREDVAAVELCGTNGGDSLAFAAINVDNLSTTCADSASMFFADIPAADPIEQRP